VLEEAWEGKGDLLSLVSEMLPAVSATLPGGDQERVLRYVGATGVGVR
jgi:hypothetical protein